MATVSTLIINAAQASQRKHNVPSSVSIAQFGGESAWGTKIPLGSYNPFGIKARPGQAFVMAMTTEVINGQLRHVEQPFRKFASFDEAFDAHGLLFNEVHLYNPALVSWEHFHDADAFVDLMAPHYATAPNYAAFIKSIMKSMNLYQYDHLPDLGQRTATPASLQKAPADVAGALARKAAAEPPNDANTSPAPSPSLPASSVLNSPAPVSIPTTAPAPVILHYSIWKDLVDRIDALERALGLRS